VLVWAVLTLFVFNSWAVAWHGWTGLLAYEVPSRAALSHGYWWTLLTYALTGAGTSLASQWVSAPLSIFFLLVVAQLAEAEMARRDFVWLCVMCALGGAAGWLPLHWAAGGPLLSGCMVLVPGLLAFWCFAMPDEPLPVRMFFTWEVRPQAVFWLVLALETGAFLSFELPQALGHAGVFRSANFDNSAHLGAMLAGWAFAWVWRRNLEISELPPPAENVSRPTTVLPVGARRVASAEAVAASTTRAVPASRKEMREEVDRILDKINRQGFGALNAQEKQTLDKARKMMKK
jgi:membrane associated rhomboid family serine protease